MIADTIEMTTKFTLVPNQMCKGIFHKLKSFDDQSSFISTEAITYQDLIEPQYTANSSTWLLYEYLNKSKFNGHADVPKIHHYWQQIQHRIFRQIQTSEDEVLIESAVSKYMMPPAFQPYWLTKQSEINHNLSIFPYQWQPIETGLFKQKGWKLFDDELMSHEHIMHGKTLVVDDFDIFNYIDPQKTTLIVLPKLTPYWIHWHHQFETGLLHRIPLKQHPLIQYCLRYIQTHWRSSKQDIKLSTEQFRNTTHQNLSTYLANREFTIYEEKLLNRFFNLLNDFNDNNIRKLSILLQDFESWINIHHANITIEHPNIHVTTVDHAYPILYNQCFLINPEEIIFDRLFFRKSQEIFTMRTHVNGDIFTPRSNYHNHQDQSLNEERLSATSLAQFQRCPLIYTCQNKLGIQDKTKHIHKMLIGILVHDTLAHFWQETKSHDALCQLQAWQIKHFVHDHLIQGIGKIKKTAEWEIDFWHFQTEQLTQMITQWIIFETQRNPFEVIAIEEKISFTYQNKRIEGRVDRVDLIDGLGHIVIDYKTGQSQSMPATMAGFPDPQMLIYTKGLNYSIQGVAYAMVFEQRMKSIQFLNPDYPDIPYHDKPNIDAILDQHITEFSEVLQPKPHQPRQCTRCEFQSICHHAGTWL